MKKLNNKGLSIVEFIVVFVMLMILTTGMMNIIINILLMRIVEIMILV